MLSKILKITGIVVAILLAGIAGLLIYLKLGYPKVGPAPEITIQATPAILKKGDYLANHVAVCMDCHSKRDWTVFSGPVIPGTEGEGGERFGREMGFPGVFYSKNITPAHLREWTDGELYRAITTGVSRQGEALFPVMPYHNFGNMDPSDVKAIIAYIRTLSPIRSSVPDRQVDFPMNFIINTFPKEATPLVRPSSRDTLAFGEYLTTIASCGECHTWKENGKVIGQPLAGGMPFVMPDGSIVRSANLTPDKETGLGNWEEESFVKLFKSLAKAGKKGKNLKPGELQTIMPWTMYGGMDSTDLQAIFKYLQSLEPVSNKIDVYTAAADISSN